MASKVQPRTLWLLANVRSKPSKIKQFLDAAQSSGAPLKLVYSHDLQLVITSTGSQLLYQGKTIPLPAGVISLVQLFTMALSSHDCEILAFFEQQQVPLLNSLAAQEDATNKLVTYRKLAQAGLPIPKTMVLYPELDMNQVKQLIGFPCIVKPMDSLKGQGVMLVDTEQQLRQLLDFTNHFMEPRQTLLIQEFIASSQGKDLRVMVLGGRVLGAMLRQGAPGAVVSNFATGAQVQQVAVTSDIEKLAVAVTTEMGLAYAGIDLLFSDSGFVVCEVNANPGFEGFHQATGSNVPLEVLNFFHQKISD